jgi:hypothetical protein
MLTREQTTYRIAALRRSMESAERQLNTLLTWGELTTEERDRLTRAANAAEFALFRVRGSTADELTCTSAIASGF